MFKLNNIFTHITDIFNSAATSEELFDSLVGNSPEKQSSPEKKPVISSGEDSPIKFTLPKKGN